MFRADNALLCLRRHHDYSLMYCDGHFSCNLFLTIKGKKRIAGGNECNKNLTIRNKEYVMEFKFSQGANLVSLVVIIAIIGIGLAVTNLDMFKAAEPNNNNASISHPVVIVQVNTPTPAPFTYKLTKDQFITDHHHLVCDTQGGNCNFGIYHAGTETFEMGMEKTVVSYNESTMTVFPHISEGNLEVGQTYAECTLSTYWLTVNGKTFTGCFEGTFLGVDGNGYHFLSNGQVMSLPHTHGAFLTINSK